MAEPLFVAALAAGVSEGASILWNAQRKADSSSSSPSPTPHALLAVSSVLYGTAALPISIIGASPGPAILSSLPHCPPLPPPIENYMSSSAKSTLESNDTVASGDTKKQLSEPSTDSTNGPKSEEVPKEDKRSELIRKTREENRRLIAAVKEKRRQQQKAVGSNDAAPRPNNKPVPITRQNGMMNRYFSTLDGRPLVTPWAEGMRRARILFVGAGLVATLISYQTQKKQPSEDESKVTTQTTITPTPGGRDLKAVGEYVKNHPGGVAIRLMKDRLAHVRSNMNATPFVFGNPPVDSNSDTLLYWRLGRTPEQWKDIPVTDDWFIQPSLDGTEQVNNESSPAKLLVVEADVSTPLSFECHTKTSSDGLLNLDSARFMSRIIEVTVRNSSVLKGDKQTASVVSVVIGSERASPLSQGSDTSKEIYVDARTALATEINLTVERLHKDLIDALPQQNQVSKNAETPETETNASPAAGEETGNDNVVVGKVMSYFDYIGEKIRQGGVSVIKVASTVLTQSEHDVPIHLFSDDKGLVRWLGAAIPGRTIFCHDTSRNKFPKSQRGGIVVVCCSTDEATCDVVCSMLSDESECNKETKVLAILQNHASETTLKWLTEDLASMQSQGQKSIDTVSVEKVHEQLFSNVKEMLGNGKTPFEIQRQLNEHSTR